MEGTGVSLRPRRRLPRPMVLTPLVDIVFLLLTFFMLSSQLTPFSLLTLQAASASGASAVSSVDETAPRPEALLSVDPGRLRLNGRTVAAADLVAALRAEVAAGATRVTLIASAEATVQDFVGALEAAKLAAFASIAVADLR